jgi:hypothetical protein
MKKNLVLVIALFTTLHMLAQQKEYFLSKAVPVGCAGANPVADVSKKATVNYKGETGVLTLKSLFCAKDFELANYSEIISKKDELFFEKYSGLGFIQTENKDLIIFVRQGEKYDILSTGNEDKKLAGSISTNDAVAIVTKVMNSLQEGLEGYDKKQKEKEAAKKQQEQEEEMRANASKMASSMGDIYNKNKGKIVFTEKKLSQDHSRDDKETDFITEFELGSSIYARAFFNEPRLNKMLNVKFSIGNVSVSSEQLRDEYGREKTSRYSGGVASASYYSSELMGHFPLISASGGYYGAMHSMTEDAFRILLSKVGPSLTRGSSHIVKVEIAYANDMFDHSGATILSGEIKMKVTEKSENLLSLLCRCSSPAKTDAAVEAEVKKLFQTDPLVTAVHKVSILQNDYKIITEYGNPVRRTLEVQVIFSNAYGWNVVWKGTVSFNYEGTKYSEKANWHKNTLYIPVAPTCVIGAK